MDFVLILYMSIFFVNLIKYYKRKGVFDMNEIKNENIKNVNEEIVVEGYANCSGDEDYRCDHDCVILGNPVISAVD